MSIEQAIISRSQHHVVASKARSLIAEEVRKGCLLDISQSPVSLEPHFESISNIKESQYPHYKTNWIAETPASVGDLMRYQVWISPHQKFDWNHSELFLKQLQAASFRVGFEVSGNNEAITISFLCNRIDQPILKAAFEGEFDSCELTMMENAPLCMLPEKSWIGIQFRDYYPPPPYSHLLTRPPELQSSPLKSLLAAMASVKPPVFGIYQVLFQPVPPEHNWHNNVQKLLDIEYTIKLLQDGLHNSPRYNQQTPSGDLKQMAWEVENKAHNDKPFYCMALRVAVVGSDDKDKTISSSLSTFTSLFQHGGRPLDYLTVQEYLKVLSTDQIRDMFIQGLTYRPGFLVNSFELSGPVHIPPLSISEHRPIPIEELETLPVRNPELLTGTWIGNCVNAGNIEPVCIPSQLRSKHSRPIGRTGVGKSTLLEHMVISDIKKGDGVAVLDPHGDFIERLLQLIPEKHVEQVIYFNPGDSDWVPLWNPIKQMVPGQDIGRTADDIVQAIKSFVSSTGWGDRLEHLLRNIIFSLIHLPDSTFLDISNLLRNKSNESKVLRRKILEVLENETARQFWLHDYERYRKDDLGPPRNKLSKLLVTGTVSLMLSQPENRLNFRKIMDEGMIFLANLSTVSTMLRSVLGSFILSNLHIAALSRSSIPIDERKQFHIHVDEAHRFMTDTIEDLIAETRKYKVSLNLAHQYMSQFGKRKSDALSSVGSCIIFNVDKTDAGYLTKDLRGLVKVDDLISLEVGEAIARIGTDVVRIKTRSPLMAPTDNFRSRIIDESRKKYYKPATEIKKLINRRNARWCSSFSPLIDTSANNLEESPEEFAYDEF